MLQLSNIHKAYGERVLFDGITTTVAPGERIALVGRNGSGKSTLFKLILGQEHSDKGDIVVPRDYRIGHLAQHLNFSQPTILDEVCLGLPHGHEDERYRGEIILAGLGFSVDDLEKAPESFSGGFQIRVQLAKVLLSEPNLLLLDEPTNYLDIVSARWLEGHLRDWPHEIMVISHDRTFLDAISTHTMLIHRTGIRKMKGSTASIYSQVAQDEEVYEQTRINLERKKQDMEKVINRFRAKASKAAMVQSKIKALDKLNIQEELSDDPTLEFSFRSVPFFGKSVIEVKNLSFGYSPELSLIEDLNLLIKPGERIGIIGKNGKGKSTLLKLIAGELTPTNGAVKHNQNNIKGYFGQSNIDRLQSHLTVEQEIGSANVQLSRTVVRTIAGAMMFSGDEALKKVSVLSGGERSRVMLGKILAHPVNLLLLDEPTNHLDLESIQALTEAIKRFDGTVIFVTHDEMLLRELATRLIVFQGVTPDICEGNYEYFLETIGWQEEGKQKPSKTTKIDSDSAKEAKRPKNKDEDRKERAKLRQERSKVLSPIQNQISAVETRIYNREALIEDSQRKLIEASQNNLVDEISELSRTVHEAQKLNDDDFKVLTELTAQYEKLCAQFEQ
jgi:ATP-binding cassette subfamily F protein 3